MSHCERYVALCIADGPCGVDVEWLGRNFGRVVGLSVVDKLVFVVPGVELSYLCAYFFRRMLRSELSHSYLIGGTVLGVLE